MYYCSTLLVLVLYCIGVNLAHHLNFIDDCRVDYCKAPNCYCSTAIPPIPGNIPQFVILSFDDSASVRVYNDLIESIFLGRRNPDGCPISGTFFVTHEYSDYTVVNKLYNEGYEIGSHSITKNYSNDYWRTASVDTIKDEMYGQGEIMMKFAHIPAADIIGSRIPQLALNKNTFVALQQSGFIYDSSWPTMQHYPFFPYTLDYKSTQQCHVEDCQTVSTPGFWQFPIIDWVDQDGHACNNLEGCSIKGDEDVIFMWMQKNFAAIYPERKTPFTLRVNLSWILRENSHAGAMRKFLDYLATLRDVFIVSEKQVLNWMRNPSETFNSCQNIVPQPCTSPNTCHFIHDGGDRYLTSCEPKCPNNYPWLGNPYGN